VPRTFAFISAILIALALGAAACGQSPPAESPAAVPAHQPEATPDASPQPTIATGQQAPVATALDRIAARHILVSHESATNKPMNVHRSANAAHSKAEKLAGRLARGEAFEALAKAESDCNSRQQGGFLGGFDRGTMHTDFEAVAFALGHGEVSDVVETPFGFHIIRREPLAEVRVAQILVGFEGTLEDSSRRSRDEARARMAQAEQRLEAGDAFADVAHDLSDGPAGIRGGDLGWFTRGQFVPAWEQVAFALEPGDRSEPFETPAGFHLLRRLE
jgi:peptidyl-prolyl cis-trans isomerase SurA